jgi:hypothetical protein
MTSSRYLQKFLIKESSITWIAALAGAIVASWMFWQEHGVLNNDAIIYLEAARLFSEGLWREGLAMYRWPLYPLLIALTHQLTTLPIQLSAHLLSVLLFSAVSMGLVTLVREAGGGYRVMWCALVLLLASPYLVGDVLPMVVRDHGAWAFHLWSMVFLLRFFQQPRWRHALAWSCSALIAVLFRIELITLLFCMPLALLFRTPLPMTVRLAQFVKCQLVLIFILFAMLVALLTTPGLDLRDFGRLHEPLKVIQRVYEQFEFGLDQKAQVIAEQVLGKFLDDYAKPALLLALVYILLIKAAAIAGWLQFGLTVAGWKKVMPVMTPDARLLLKWVVGLGLLNGAFILLKGFILPSRMLAPIGFAIIVLAAFALSLMWEHWCQGSATPKLQRGALTMVGALVALQLIVVYLPETEQKRNEKVFELQAAQWVKANVSDVNRVYFDSLRTAYYAGVHFDRIAQIKAWKKREGKFKAAEIYSYDYAVIRGGRVNAKDENIFAKRLGSPIVSFAGGRKGTLMVYRVPEPDLLH